MKCVCPMGGDRTCPDDCPIAIWQVLSPSDRKAQRKPIAARLYRQGFTMEAIATQLGQSTITEDLRNLSMTDKLGNCVCGRVSAGSRVSLPASVAWRAKFIAVAKAFSSPSIVTNGLTIDATVPC